VINIINATHFNVLYPCTTQNALLSFKVI